MCVEFPVITSIYPNSPGVVLNTYSEYVVPIGHSGTVFTCTAFGWPIPFVEWLRDGQYLTGRVRSEFVHIAESSFVSAQLIWEDGFYPFDVGNYTCIVRDLPASQIVIHSKLISIDYSPVSSSSIIAQAPCAVNSLETHFQIRVLNTNCSLWENDLKQLIARDLSDVLRSAVSSECHYCMVASDNVEVVGVTCSEQVEHAVLLRGVIRTGQLNETESVFCALSRWKQNGPSLLLNGSSHFVDQECGLRVDSTGTSECFISSSSTGFLLPNKLASTLLILLSLLPLP